MQRFDEKLPIESVVLTFDFSNALDAGEILLGSPVITFSTLYGGDVNPSALANGPVQIDLTQTMVLVPIIGGLDENDYVIVAECSTSNAKKQLAWAGILPVRQYPSQTSNC